MSDIEPDYIVCKYCGKLVPTLNLDIHEARCGNRILSSNGGIEGSLTTDNHLQSIIHTTNAHQHQVIDLVENSEDHQQLENVWSCPRCTFFNSSSNDHCDMCNYSQVNARNPDPVRRERLIVTDSLDHDLGDLHSYSNTRYHHELFRQHQTRDNNGNRHIRNSTNSSLAAVAGGTALGSIVGGISSYIRGRPISDGIFRGGINGAVSGAIIDSLLLQRNSPRNLTPTQNLPSSPISREVANTQYENNLLRRQSQMPPNEEMFYAMLDHMIDSGALSPRQVNSMDNSDFEQLLHIFGDGTENMGADEMDIDILPTQTIINVEKELRSRDLRQCAICLDDFKSGDQRKTLPCLHGYHKACIDRALRNRAYCPLCNSGINS
jgi:Ring finger domain